MTACQKQVNGGAVLVNMQPSPPSFSGTYDFDLVNDVTGKACVYRGVESDEQYWVIAPGLERSSGDAATDQAMHAAVFNAVRSNDADTMLLTSVVSKTDENGKTCATVYGKAVKIRKGVSTTETLRKPRPEAAEKAVLQLIAKPPCQVTVDGNSTGRTTPISDLSLSPGNHRVRLTNAEYGIDDSFDVTLISNDSQLVTRDYLSGPNGAIAITLSTEAIEAGVQLAMDRVRQCASLGRGLVRVTLTISPPGAVVAATVAEAKAADAGKCVAAALRDATFAQTRNGATTTVPITL